MLRWRLMTLCISNDVANAKVPRPPSEFRTGADGAPVMPSPGQGTPCTRGADAEAEAAARSGSEDYAERLGCRIGGGDGGVRMLWGTAGHMLLSLRVGRH